MALRPTQKSPLLTPCPAHLVMARAKAMKNWPRRQAPCHPEKERPSRSASETMHADVGFEVGARCYCMATKMYFASFVPPPEGSIVLPASNIETAQQKGQPNFLESRVVRLTESYNRVQFEPIELTISRSRYASTAACVSPSWNRSRRC